MFPRGGLLSCCIYSRSFYYQSSLTLHWKVYRILCALYTSGNNQQTSAGWPQKSRWFVLQRNRNVFWCKTNDLWIVACFKTNSSIEGLCCAEQLLFRMSCSCKRGKTEESPLNSYKLLRVKALISLLNLVQTFILEFWYICVWNWFFSVFSVWIRSQGVVSN